MKTRNLSWVSLLLALASPAHPPAQAASPARPNVLFISVDDLRDWVGYLGKHPQAVTPHFDRLASHGVVFERAYCAAPSCNPSRAALMSGLRPSTSGVYVNAQDWRPHVPPELTLVTTMRKAGYETLAVGKIYHGHWDRHSEWEEYASDRSRDPQPSGSETGVGAIQFAPLDCSDEEMQDSDVAAYGIRQLSRKHDRPFFLCVGFRKPHLPWNVPRKYYDLHPLETIQLPPALEGDLNDVPKMGVNLARHFGDHERILKAGKWKEAVRGYLASISFVDAMLGRLLDAFERSEYRDNTIVILWSDHGWNLGEKEHWRKFALWEDTTRSPLIVVAPGLTTAGTRCEQPVDLMTIYPTITDLCGIPTPKHVEGRSLRPLLANPAANWDQPAIMTWGRNNHAIRSIGWRFIRYSDGTEELYDESADPNEWRNLAANPQYKAEKERLAKWIPARNAPDVPRRPGGSEEDPDAKQKSSSAKQRTAD